jgi:YebC/PmpR family DNA-binding regulatory protein
MPSENIERAIKRGIGGAEETALAEVTYEGYGPGGIAILLQALTDNRNRTLAQVRHLFTEGGGSLGESGCVSWLFDHKGVIVVETNKVDPQELALHAIDAGADDIKIEDASVEIYTNPEDLEAMRKQLEQKEIPIISAELSLIPKTTVKLDEKAAVQALKLLEKLEGLDEVQHVFANADFPNEIIAKYQG